MRTCMLKICGWNRRQRAAALEAQNDETNTIMTDADSVSVTGRADPIRIIQQLQAAQSVATQQLAETQQAMVDTTAMAVDYIYEQDSKIFGGDDDDDQTDAVPT